MGRSIMRAMRRPIVRAVRKPIAKAIVKPIAKGLASGLLGGLAASWIMNQFQMRASKLIENKQRPHGGQSVQEGSPQHGAGAELQQLGIDDRDDNAAERTANIIAVKTFDRELSEGEKHAGGEVTHYAFGATTGAVYGMAAEFIPEVTVGAGLPFGAAVWLVADEIVVPALGLSRGPTHIPLSKHSVSLAAHLVYGVTTDIVRRVARNALNAA
jgi:putative membrane protein